MKDINTIFSVLLLTGTLASSVATASAQSPVSSAVVAPGYCHKKFPAIREETLFSKQPVLKDPSDGDLIDFYGPCDYDPLGKDAIVVQRAAFRIDRKTSSATD